MFGCTSEAKTNAYKALVRPFLEHACAVWNPCVVHDIDLLESVQNRATHWIKALGICILLGGQNLQVYILKNFDGLP